MIRKKLRDLWMRITRKRTVMTRLEIRVALGGKCIMRNYRTGKQCDNKNLDIHCKLFLGADSEEYDEKHRLSYITNHLDEFELFCKKHHDKIHRLFTKLDGRVGDRAAIIRLITALGGGCSYEGCDFPREPLYLHRKHGVKVDKKRKFNAYWSLRYNDEVELLCGRHVIAMHDGIKYGDWGISQKLIRYDLVKKRDLT